MPGLNGIKNSENCATPWLRHTLLSFANTVLRRSKHDYRKDTQQCIKKNPVSNVKGSRVHEKKLVLMEMGMEVSFDKLYKRIQERAFSLLLNILITISTAVKQFLQEINRLAIACIKTRQPSRKTTLELLDDIHAFLLP